MDDKLLQTLQNFNNFYHELQKNANKIEINLSSIEIKCIQVIEKNHDTTAKKLQDILDIDRGFLSRILKTLENKNIVRRIQSKSDKRVYFLRLTKQGKTSYKQVIDSKNQAFKQTFSHLNDEELESFVGFLSHAQNVYNQKDDSLNKIKTAPTINEKCVTYIQDDTKGIWQAHNQENCKTIASLFFLNKDSWSAELSLIKTEDCPSKVINKLLQQAIKYAELNYVDHLYLFDQQDTLYSDLYTELEFINTEEINDVKRFDLFLSIT